MTENKRPFPTNYGGYGEERDDNRLSPVSYGRGFVQNKGVCRVIMHNDELSEHGFRACSLMMWSARTRRWHEFQLAWRAITVACNPRQMFALGELGQLLVADATGAREERVVEVGGDGEQLTDLAIAGERLVAVGRGGQVLRREGGGVWASWDQGLPGAGERPSLRTVHGLDEGEIYAAGDGGELWCARDGNWSRLETPVDTDLVVVRAAGPGLAYAAGRQGTLLRAQEGVVERIDTGLNQGLRGLQMFEGRLYAAGAQAVFVLEDDDTLRDLGVGYGTGWTFRHLHAADGVMWSFGRFHLFQTTDGEKWEPASPPVTTLDPSEAGPLAGQSGCDCGHDHR